MVCVKFNIGKLLGSGHRGQVYTLGEDQVLKVLPNPNHLPSAQYEFGFAKLAYDLGIQTPKPDQIMLVNKLPSMSFERVHGVSVSEYVLKRPWKLISTTKKMAKLLADIHSHQAPKWAYPKKRALKERIKTIPELDEKTKADILAYLDTLEDGDALCHNDFHAANVLVQDQELFVIDWGGGKKADALADLTHAYVLNKVDGIPEDTPRAIKAFIRLARRWYIELFLYYYAKYSTRYSYREIKRGIKRWIVPVAAGRLASYGVFETPALLKIINKNLYRIYRDG